MARGFIKPTPEEIEKTLRDGILSYITPDAFRHLFRLPNGEYEETVERLQKTRLSFDPRKTIRAITLVDNTLDFRSDIGTTTNVDSTPEGSRIQEIYLFNKEQMKALRQRIDES